MRENNVLHHVPVGTVFQLDGAPLHFSHNVCALLDREFDCWIGRGGGHFLALLLSRDDLPGFWEFVKDIVYCEKV
jgi:hypothetical protein